MFLNWLKKIFGSQNAEAPKQEAAPAASEPAQEPAPEAADTVEQSDEVK
jgi:hypothetical protein